MTDANTVSSKDVYNLIRLQYGSSGDFQYVAYTDWSSNLPGNPDFVSTPSLEIMAPENTGVLDAKNLILDMPVDDFLETLASGEPFSAVYLEITEFSKSSQAGVSGVNRKFFRGFLLKTIKNPSGKSNRVRLHFSSLKALLEVPMGIKAMHHCPWTLFKGGCQINEATHTVTKTITNIDGKVVTIDSSPGKTGAYFHRGFMRKDGIRVGIQYWHNDSNTTFYMTRRPPSAWLNQNVNIIAGCDKTIETCRDRFNAEEFFAGIGYKIPAYNPNIENPE
jgi:hypothetical protein